MDAGQIPGCSMASKLLNSVSADDSSITEIHTGKTIPVKVVTLPSGVTTYIPHAKLIEDTRKRPISYSFTNNQSGQRPPTIIHPVTSSPAKLLKVDNSIDTMPTRGNKKKKKNKSKGPKNSNSNEESGESEYSDSGTPEQEEEVDVEGAAEEEVLDFSENASLKNINKNLKVLAVALLGDEKQKILGMKSRLDTLENDVNRTDKKNPGLKSRVTNLEFKWAQHTKKPPTSTPVPAPTTSAAEVGSVPVSSLQDYELLQESYEVLKGFASKIQRSQKSLQNQVYIQQDRQNYLNLQLGGVTHVEDTTCRQQAVTFFKEILSIDEVAESDFVKAYRRSDPRSYTEETKDGSGKTVKLKVAAPGVMFVRLSSELLREQALARSRTLGGKRHPVHNHKYFVSKVECEAVKATKEKHKDRVAKIHKDNKDFGKNDSYHFHGQQFFVNGKLVQDVFSPPSYDEVLTAMREETTALKTLDLHKTEPYIKDDNTFRAYGINTRRMDVVRLAYIKVYMLNPTAGHVMMSYRIGKHQGSCDDDEFKGGVRLLKVLQSQKFKNGAIFVTRHSQGRQLGSKRFDYISDVAKELIDFMKRAASNNIDAALPPPDPALIERLTSSQDVVSSQESAT